ncbi:hypothetical protein AAE02nite_15690 [Adhaeribacter aerolatus]|uniref:Uncharacterized protein n=1 Tax=Adhaeribacter aerolatus TaxID=670289 RepID=A0A512AW24_9BACT|nr:hypothetical protein [Adhaeribacter aerolatus]GEO03905.1 hypothetical protein AAE02nite_15690 [Adhaeribacter aerolatus]
MIELIEKYVVDGFGNINLPESEDEKRKLARALLGLSLIGNLDNWLNNAFDLIDNHEPEEPFLRENALSRKDKAFRLAFAHLDNAVKEKIKEIIIDTASGVLFSSLVTFDQFEYGDICISLRPKTLDGKSEALDISDKWEDLHDELPEWIENFSNYRKELKS